MLESAGAFHVLSQAQIYFGALQKAEAEFEVQASGRWGQGTWLALGGIPNMARVFL